MVTLIKILQVIIAMSLLIFIHELGHFAWARLFGIKVEKFFLFFDVGGKALLRFRRGDTEFGIGWLPFGGYCKIAGMVDESLDTEAMKREPQPWEFRTKAPWKRLLVLFGGVLNNFLFAMVAYILIMFIWGQGYIENKGAKIIAQPLAVEMGFRSGDEILLLDDYEPYDFGMIQADIARRSVRSVTLRRGADTVRLYIDGAMTGRLLNEALFDIAIPFVVDSVMHDSPNAAAGLVSGDRLVAVNGTRVEYLQDTRPLLQSLPGQTVEASIIRGADTLSRSLQVDSLGRIGVFVQMPAVKHMKYSFLEAVPAGLKLSWETVTGYLKDLKLLATPSTGAYKSVGSFIAIGQIMPSQWDWNRFMTILALLSIMLGVMNLIPIPGLDGGHILFTLFEMLTGRKPSERFLYVTQLIGMFLLLALMFLAFGNDIGRLIR